MFDGGTKPGIKSNYTMVVGKNFNPNLLVNIPVKMAKHYEW